MNSARAVVSSEDLYSKYTQQRVNVSNPIERTQVIEGYFYKENLMKDMAIRKINMTLCIALGFLVLTAFISYYSAMSNEITLNTLSRQVTTLNEENSELQNTLDRMKSFNNVDSMMEKQNILTKAASVIEVPRVASAAASQAKKNLAVAVDWSVGY